VDEPNGSVRKRQWAQNKVYMARSDVNDPNNPYMARETVTAGNMYGYAAQTAVTDYIPDKNGNLLHRTEYDWVPYAGGNVESGTNVKRATTLTYYRTAAAATSSANDPNAYWQPHLSSARRLDAVLPPEITHGSA